MSPTLAVSPLSPERACAIQRSWTRGSGDAGTRGRGDASALGLLLLDLRCLLFVAIKVPIVFPTAFTSCLPRFPASPPSCLLHLYPDSRLHLAPVDERRPIRHNL